mmetsp:Transcript_9169/g.40361  ORF Transcript_9169/g.40361 Transcript_9169/m.40361 type:complete len:346 (-) Transcript_9169:1101-2138(-)
MPHPTRLSKAHMAQLKAGIDRRVAGVKSKIDNAMDTIESRAEKVKVLRHGMLRRQLSFFSVPPEDREDPIPHTNVFLGVLYVLGAVAALCFALIDSSCEEVTAYREDAPIDTCTEMLASFSCRTADYNRTAGTGFSKIFDKTTCLEGRNATEEKFGHHPVGLCGSMKEGVFTCQTSEYDNTGVPKNRSAYENWDKIENGFRRTFERDACPSEVPHAAVSWVYAAHPANTSHLFSDKKFRCETADFVAGPNQKVQEAKGMPTCTIRDGVQGNTTALRRWKSLKRIQQKNVGVLFQTLTATTNSRAVLLLMTRMLAPAFREHTAQLMCLICAPHMSGTVILPKVYLA